MDGLVPILVAIIGSTGTIVGALLGARRLARRGGRRAGPDADIAAGWRQQAELEKARAELLDEQLSDEREARAAALARIAVLEDELRDTHRALDNCVRQRNSAFSDLRAAERRRTPRPPAMSAE